MSRKQSPLEELLEVLLALLKVLPWWVGPPFIFFVWLLFQFILPGIFGYIGDAQSGKPVLPIFDMFASICVILSPILTAVVFLVWLVAIIQKLGNSKRLERMTGLDSIRDLHWSEFEQLLAEAFRRQGYSVQDTGPGADGGIDLILHKDGRKELVQAKQWNKYKVGVKVVRELYGVQTAQHADSAILVTSGSVTADARRFAEQNALRIIEGAQLEQMIASVQRSQRDATVQVEKRVTEVAKPPACPQCGALMIKRTARRGSNAGQAFWGCSQFPACRGTRTLTPD